MLFPNLSSVAGTVVLSLSLFFWTRRDEYARQHLLAHATDTERQIFYATQLEHTNNCFNAVGIKSSTEIQIKRGSGARAAELHGVAESQVCYAL